MFLMRYNRTIISLKNSGLRMNNNMFQVCTEWLTLKLTKYQIANKLKGVRIVRTALHVTLLLFADNSDFFLKATINNEDPSKEVLDLNGTLSRQKLNFQKSEIFFSRNISAELRNNICNSLKVSQVHCVSKYIRLPSILATTEHKHLNVWLNVHRKR